MGLTISLRKTGSVLQEPILIDLELELPDAGLRFPVIFRSTDVVELSLHGADGAQLELADGYTVQERQGKAPRRVAQAALKTTELQPGQPLAWTQDLLAAFDLASPGDYSVRARVRFEPAGIDLLSDPVSFTIAENRHLWLDASEDAVTLKMGYLLQQHDAGAASTTLVHCCSGKLPVAPWKSASLELPRDARPRVSETDFVDQTSFGHDFFRWLAWVADGRLWATSVDDGRPLGAVLEQGGLGAATLAGRPVQHLDRSVSVRLLEPTDAGYRLVRHDFDPGFAPLGSQELATFDAAPGPLAIASDWKGRAVIVTGEAGGLPLRLLRVSPDGSAQSWPLLGPTGLTRPRGPLEEGFDVQVLGLTADVGAFNAPVAAVLATLIARRVEEELLRTIVFLLRFPLGEDGPGQPEWATVTAGTSVAAEADELFWADQVQTPKGEPWVCLGTRSGRLLVGSATHAPLEQATTRPDWVEQAKLLVSTNGMIFLASPTPTSGVDRVLCFAPPER